MPFIQRAPLDFTNNRRVVAGVDVDDPQPEAEVAVERPATDVVEAGILAPAPSGDNQEVATVGETPPAPPTSAVTALTPRGAPEPLQRRTPYWIALVAGLVWAAGIAALALSTRGVIAGGFAGAAILLLLAAAPLGFAWATAFAVVQARALLAESRRARRFGEEMIGPTIMAVGHTSSVVQAMQTQIRNAAETATIASERMATMHQSLVNQTEQLALAASTADRTARTLVERLSSQRGELNTLAVTLEARAAAVTDAINRQARMVADASDLAETQLREAEALLAARAADLAVAAAEAQDVSRTASEDLARQVARLETAGVGVGEQLRSVEDGLTQQRAALVTVAHALRGEQEDFATLAETRTAQLSAFLSNAGRDVAALNEVTAAGARSMSELVETAAGKLRELTGAAKAERDLFGASAASSLNTLSEIGANERRALEEQMRQMIRAMSDAAAEAREAADLHAEAARARVEQLNEAAFSAGQRADHVFESRLGDARNLIAQSARLIEEAGASTAAKLEQGIVEARSAIDELRQMVNAVVADVARLPSETEARATEIRLAIAKGMEELLAMARRTAEETESIDAAFQERVKRNYEMLSEAVQLMGVVAQGGQSAMPHRQEARKTPATPPLAEPATPTQSPSTEATPAPRPRLKLTPETAAPPPASPAAAASGAPVSAASDAEPTWSWKGLLSAVDESPNGEDAAGGREIADDIVEMGIDPAALLSRNRVSEIAAAVQTRDFAGAREVVRGLAPAAVRRLSRRLLADEDFRVRCRAFQETFAHALDAAAERDHAGFEATALLSRNTGRAYLLIDAAIGEKP